ncbi:MAG: helicase-related protein [Candidatus Hermodarchaeia archaeon]
MSDKSKFTPRLYQLNARDQILKILETEEKHVFIVLLPTGMGKTFISTLTLEMLFEREILAKDEKVLFLVQDRKLKHQLYEMAKSYGLTTHGYLFLLDDQKTLPAKMTREHAALAKFIFATPILLMNAVSGKNKRIDKATLNQVKVVIIDEILDIFAQSYGKKRPRKDTIAYIEQRFGNGRSFNQIITDLKKELEASDTIDYEVDETRLADQVVREFSFQSYRLNKTYEPILHFLNLINSQSDRIIIGLTASLSQDVKINLLKKTFGGEEHVAEIRPIGDDFENYQPAYELKRIRVFDEWITDIDNRISDIKRAQLKQLNKAYQLITGNPKIPSDRILLFITDLLRKNGTQKKLREHYAGNEQQVVYILGAAQSYLLMTVARQHLLEGTFSSFRRFINGVTNRVLLSNTDFTHIKEQVEERTHNKVPDQKEQRLLYWLERFASQGKRMLILCRFVEMTRHLANLANQKGIQSNDVHGKMSGSTQFEQISSFKAGDVMALFASERLIEKGTDLPEADVGIYYGTTLSLARYEQSLGRIRSNVQTIKTLYTLSYDQTIEAEKSLKRDTMFLELMGKRLPSINSKNELTD